MPGRRETLQLGPPCPVDRTGPDTFAQRGIGKDARHDLGHARIDG